MNEQIGIEVYAETQRFQRGVNGIISKLGGTGTLAVAGAAAAAGAAIAAFATKGVQSFARLETGMSEVFTLMPGMTDEAMRGMTEDVQAFADEFGVLTGDVVPALYDSISAGVPPGNVFDFLEQANQLAVGGVTDLNTAVDGLTSATNAYGPEVLSAADASDVLFTAVRQGKTTVEELSRAVSDTAPIAASLGITFDEVNASLAAMTSQGEPTRRAATKLRQAMAELSTEGSKAYDQFGEINGESFPTFIENGGSLQEALVMMADAAEANGGRIGDSFGSIEASQAAQMLTSDQGRAKMDENMAAMADRAGATAAAYDQMDQTLGRAWDRMKAKVQTFVQDAGQALAPLAGEILNNMLDGFDRLEAGISTVIDFISNLFREQTGAMASDGDTFIGQLSDTFSAFGELVTAIFNRLQDAWEMILKPAWEAMQPLVEGIIGAVSTVLSTFLETTESLFRAFAAFLDGDWKTAWTEMQNAVRTLTEGLGDALEQLWNGLRDTLANVADDLRRRIVDSFTRLKDWLAGSFSDGVSSTLRSLFDSFGGLMQGGLDAVMAGFEWLRDGAVSIMDGMAEAIASVAGGLAAMVRDAFGNVLDWLTGQVNGVIDAVNGFIDRLNRALEIEIPDIGFTISLPEFMGGDRRIEVNTPDIDIPDIPSIPHLARGGIVDRATLAMIGEAGPEAVIPLDRLGTMGGQQVIIVELDGREIGRTVAPRLVDQLRVRTGLT